MSRHTVAAPPCSRLPLQVEDFFPTQEFELSPKDFGPDGELKLKFHKFQKVSSLVVRRLGVHHRPIELTPR